MNAVAIITPEPKYFAAKKPFSSSGLLPAALFVITGNNAPKRLPMRMTNIDDMRGPMLPLKSFPAVQWPRVPSKGTRMVPLVESERAARLNASMRTAIVFRCANVVWCCAQGVGVSCGEEED